MSGESALALIIVAIIFGIGIFLIPTIIAAGKKYQAGIFFLTLGSSLTAFIYPYLPILGWIAAFIWAVCAPRKNKHPEQPNNTTTIVHYHYDRAVETKQTQDKHDDNYIPTLQEWRKQNPHKGINDYYAKYGRRF